MKKLLATICLLLILPVLSIAAAGCNGGWKEVQSITYTTDEGKTTLTSECYYNIEHFFIEQSEYDAAITEQESDIIYLIHIINRDKQSIDADRKNLKATADSLVGKSYYYKVENDYCKLTLNNYTLNYVKVKFVSDKVLEIDFKGEQKRVNTLSYDVTYFMN